MDAVLITTSEPRRIIRLLAVVEEKEKKKL
jgi:hypothetical protein